MKSLTKKIKDDGLLEPEIDPKLRTKKTLHNVKEYHTPSNLVGKVAKLTNCKKLVLTHFVPTRFNVSKLKKIVKKDFGKDPIIGEDLLTINI